MNSIDLTPLYRNSIGFDRVASLIDAALATDTMKPGFPPYNIEMLNENKYAITLAVAGYEKNQLDIKVEKGVLSIRGEKPSNSESQFLHQGISDGKFERRFNIADYVEVVSADLNNGLLTIKLVKEIPEEMKPKKIAINDDSNVIEHQAKDKELSQKSSKAA